MGTARTDSKTIGLALPKGHEAEPPLYRSRYGGLWVDRRDAHELLDAKVAGAEVTSEDAKVLAFYIDHGYVVFPKATDEEVIDGYLELFEGAWDRPPRQIYLHWKRQVLPMDRKYYDEVTKVSDLHCCFERAGELIFPPPVLRFLTQIFERPPVAFQTMTMRKGSEENLHIDTGPLTLTEPLSMAASWVALEDIKPDSGEFEFVPGSHALPELLHYGTDKGHGGDFAEYGKILDQTLQMCDERDLRTERFMAKKGDVLIWHADLMHGGARIADQSLTRKSMVAHFMPLGVMATFYDFSRVNAVPYQRGGYCLDRLLYDTTPRHLREARAAEASAEAEPAAKPGRESRTRPEDLWRRYVPASVRKKVPPSVSDLARKHLPH
jgi:ectoine hydroxylase-related dioxygenase (phytanoyl-CoA dioxygenase family)